MHLGVLISPGALMRPGIIMRPGRTVSSVAHNKGSAGRLCIAWSGASSAAPAASTETTLSPSHQPAGAKRRRLWDTSPHVQHIQVEDAEELYLSLTSRTNEQHVLMMVHAPWCPSCQGIEAEVEKLAMGLQHEPSLIFTALDADSAAARYFAKEVLGLQLLPSYVLFPKGSKTFYKYKGQGQDAGSLLKFLNMVCNQAEDTVWTLGGEETGKSVGAAAGTAGSRLAPVLPMMDSKSATGIPLGLVGGGLLLVFLAALRFIPNPFLSNGVPSDSNAVMGLSVTGQPIPSKGQLVQDIDTLVTRMSNLMVQLVGARASLSVVDEEVLGAPLAKGQLAEAKVEGDVILTEATSHTPLEEAGQVTTVPVLSEAEPVGREASPEANLPEDDGEGPWTVGRQMSPEEARLSPLPGQEAEMQLTGETFTVKDLSSDEVLSMLEHLQLAPSYEKMLRDLEQEGEDMQRVMQRLVQLKGGMSALTSVTKADVTE